MKSWWKNPWGGYTPILSANHGYKPYVVGLSFFYYKDTRYDMDFSVKFIRYLQENGLKVVERQVDCNSVNYNDD